MGPLPGPEIGLLSNTQEWIVQGDTRADKARDFTGKGNPGEELCHMACSLWFYGDGNSFWVVLANHSDSESFLVVQALFSQDGCQRGFWEVVGHVVPPFELSWISWWRLISSVFLTRTSCHKTTQANGYYGAWPGWAVSKSVLPLTECFQ